MIYPFEHDDFQGISLAVCGSSFFKSAYLLVDDVKVKGKRAKFSVNDTQGATREIKLKINIFDPVPKVEIDGAIIQLTRSLTWYEYLWMSLPIMLIFVGGGLGAMFGMLATYSSSKIFRSDKKTGIKYLLSGAVSLSAIVIFLISAGIIQYIINSNRDVTSKEYLMEVAEISNKDLPVMIDEQTELVKLEGIEGILVYHYRLPTIKPGQITSTYLIEQLSPSVTSNTCSIAETRENFLDKGVTLRYIYNDLNNGEIARFDIEVSDCH